MGEWGPTATPDAAAWLVTKLSRWGNGGQPQPRTAGGNSTSQLSRWGNGGQPQRRSPAEMATISLADGGMGANRNRGGLPVPELEA